MVVVMMVVGRVAIVVVVSKQLSNTHSQTYRVYSTHQSPLYEYGVEHGLRLRNNEKAPTIIVVCSNPLINEEQDGVRGKVGESKVLKRWCDNRRADIEVYTL